MALIEESPLADSRALEAGVHVVNRRSPAVDLGGSERSILRLLRLVSLDRLLVPNALARGLLLVTALILLVTLDLIVDKRDSFASLLDSGLSSHLDVRFVEVHVGVLCLELLLQALNVGTGLILGDVGLLLENLTVSGNLNGIVQLQSLSLFPAGVSHI